MTSERIVLVFLTVVYVLSGRGQGCYFDLASQCPYYTLVNQLSVIPILDPDHLDTICDQAQQSLRCLLNPSKLGLCDMTTKTVYNSILNVLGIPCQRLKQDYLSGGQCWRSSAVKAMMKICYNRYKADITADYCSGQPKFINCTTTDILTLPNCGAREQRVLTAMVVRSYNDNGLVMRPPCPEINTSGPMTTTTTTTTTTPTTTTTTIAAAATKVLPTSLQLTSSKESTTSMSNEESTTPSSTLEPTTKSGRRVGKAQQSRSTGDRTLPALLLLLFGLSVCLSGLLN